MIEIKSYEEKVCVVERKILKMKGYKKFLIEQVSKLISQKQLTNNCYKHSKRCCTKRLSLKYEFNSSATYFQFGSIWNSHKNIKIKSKQK